MNYKFTAILILLFIGLTMFAKPAYPKNEYLNNGTNTCSTGSVEASIEKEDRDNDYRHFNNDNNYDNYCCYCNDCIYHFYLQLLL